MLATCIPLLFVCFALYGSLPLAFAVYRNSAKATKVLAGLVALNILLLFFYLPSFVTWQLRAQIICIDGFICFLVAMGFIAYALPSIKPLSSNAFKLILLNFAALIFFRLIYFFLRFSFHWHLTTYDPLLYQIDASLGFIPSADVAKLFLPYLNFSYFIYASLPFAFFLVCAHQYWHQKNLPNALIKQCFLAGVIAWILYNIVPAVGPVHAFPDTWLQVQIMTKQKMLLVTQYAPRNCMPSLHVAWIYLLWRWVEKTHRDFRLLMFFWLLLTCLCTLTTGEHYLIDLLLGVVFAVFIRALCQKNYLIIAVSIILYGIWMLLIFFGVNFLAQYLYLNWMIWLLTLIIALVLDHLNFNSAFLIAL